MIPFRPFAFLVLAIALFMGTFVEARLGDGGIQQEENNEHRELFCTTQGYCRGLTPCCSGYYCRNGFCFPNQRLLEGEEHDDRELSENKQQDRATEELEQENMSAKHNDFSEGSAPDNELSPNEHRELFCVTSGRCSRFTKCCDGYTCELGDCRIIPQPDCRSRDAPCSTDGNCCSGVCFNDGTCL